jgi:hypothetical protein
LIFIFGVGFGAFRYCQSPPSDSDDANPAALMFDSKVYQRQVETMVGKFGLVSSEWMRTLGEPKPMAITIIIVSILVTGDCFLIPSYLP